MPSNLINIELFVLDAFWVQIFCKYSDSNSDVVLQMKAEVIANTLYLMPMVLDWGRIEPTELGKL